MNTKISKGKRFWAWALSAAMVLTAAPVNLGVTKEAKAAELKSTGTKEVYTMPLFNDGTSAYAIKYPSELYLGSDLNATLVKVPMDKAKAAYEAVWKPYAKAKKEYDDKNTAYQSAWDTWQSKLENAGKTEADYAKTEGAVAKPTASDEPEEPTVIENYEGAEKVGLADIGIYPDDKSTEAEDQSKGYLYLDNAGQTRDDLSFDYVKDELVFGNEAGEKNYDVYVMLPQVKEKSCYWGDYTTEDTDILYDPPQNGLGDSYILVDDDEAVPDGKERHWDDRSFTAKLTVNWLSLLKVSSVKAAVNGGAYSDLAACDDDDETAAAAEKYDLPAAKGDRVAVKTDYEEVSEDNFKNILKDDQDDLKGGRHYEIKVTENWNSALGSYAKDAKGNTTGVFEMEDASEENGEEATYSCTYTVRRQVYDASGERDDTVDDSDVVLETKTIEFHREDITEYTYNYLGKDEQYGYFLKYAKDNFVGDDFSYRLYQVKYAVRRKDEDGNDVLDEKNNPVYVPFKNGTENVDPSKLALKTVKKDYLKWTDPNENKTIEALNKDAEYNGSVTPYSVDKIISLSNWNEVLGASGSDVDFRYAQDASTERYTWQMKDDGAGASATSEWRNTNLTTIKDKLSANYPELSFKELPSYSAETMDELARDGMQIPGTVYERDFEKDFYNHSYTVGAGFFTTVLEDTREEDGTYKYTNDTTDGEDAISWSGIQYQFQTGTQSYVLALPVWKESHLTDAVKENGIELTLNWKAYPAVKNEVKNDNYHFTKDSRSVELEVPSQPDAVLKDVPADRQFYGYDFEWYYLQYMDKDGEWNPLTDGTLQPAQSRDGKLSVDIDNLKNDDHNGLYEGSRNVRYASISTRNARGFGWRTDSSSWKDVLFRDDKTFQTYTLVGVEEYPVSIWDPSDDTYKQTISLAKKVSEGDKLTLAPVINFADGYAKEAAYQWQKRVYKPGELWGDSYDAYEYEDIEGATDKEFKIDGWQAPKKETYDQYKLTVTVKISEDEVYTATAEYTLTKETVEALFRSTEQVKNNRDWINSVAAGDQISFTYGLTKADYVTDDNYDVEMAWTRHSIETITDIEYAALEEKAKKADEDATKAAQAAADKKAQDAAKAANKPDYAQVTAEPVSPVTAEQDKLTKTSVTIDGKEVPNHPYKPVYVEEDGTEYKNSIPANTEYAKKYYYHEVEEELSTTEALSYTVTHQDFKQKITKGYEYKKVLTDPEDPDVFTMEIKTGDDGKPVEQTYKEPVRITVGDKFYGDATNPETGSEESYEGTYFTFDIKAEVKDSDTKNTPYNSKELFEKFDIYEETNFTDKKYNKDESPYTVVKDKNTKYFTEGDNISITAPEYTINVKDDVDRETYQSVADKNAYKVTYQWQRLVELKQDETKGTPEKQYVDGNRDGQKRVYTGEDGKTVTKYYLYEDWEGKTDKTLTISDAAATETDKVGYRKYYDKYRCIITPLRWESGNRTKQIANENAPATMKEEKTSDPIKYYYRVKVLPKGGTLADEEEIEAKDIEAYRVSDYKQYVPLGGKATMEVEAELLFGDDYFNDKEHAVEYKENDSKTILNFQWRHNGEILSGATIKKGEESSRCTSSFTVDELKLDGKGTSYGTYICRIWVTRKDGKPNENSDLGYQDVEFVLAEKTDIDVTNFAKGYDDNRDMDIYEAYLYGKNIDDSFDFTVDAVNTSGTGKALTYTWAKKIQDAEDKEWDNLSGNGFALVDEETAENTHAFTIKDEDDYTDYECIVSNGRSKVLVVLHVQPGQTRVHTEITNTKIDNDGGTQDYFVPENGSQVLSIDTEIEDTKHIGVEYTWSKEVKYGATDNYNYLNEDDTYNDDDLGHEAYKEITEAKGNTYTVSEVQEKTYYRCYVKFYYLDDDTKSEIESISRTFYFTVDVEEEDAADTVKPEFERVNEYGYDQNENETHNRLGDKVRFGVELDNEEDYDGELTYIWRFTPVDKKSADYVKTDGKYNQKRLVNQKDGVISIAELKKEDFGQYTLEIQYETTETVTDPTTGKKKQVEVLKTLRDDGGNQKIYTFNLNQYSSSSFTAKAKNGTGNYNRKPGDSVTFKTEVELDEEYTDGTLYYNWVNVAGESLYGENDKDKTLTDIKKWDFGSYQVQVTLIDSDGNVSDTQTVSFTLNRTDNLRVESNLLTDNNVPGATYTNAPHTWNYTRYFGDKISFAVKAETDTPEAHPIHYTWSRASVVNGNYKYKELKDAKDKATYAIDEILKKDFKVGGVYTYHCIVSNDYDTDIDCYYVLRIQKPNADDQFLYFDDTVVDAVADAEEIGKGALASIWESYQGEEEDIKVTTTMYETGTAKEQSFEAEEGEQITMSADAIADTEDADLITYTWKHWDPVQQRYVQVEGAESTPHLTVAVEKDDLKENASDYVHNPTQYICEVTLDDDESTLTIDYSASIGEKEPFKVEADKQYVLEGKKNSMKATLNVKDKKDFTYQWYAADADGNVSRLEGETGDTYEVPAEDIKLKHVNKNDKHRDQSYVNWTKGYYGYEKPLEYYCVAEKAAEDEDTDPEQYVKSGSFTVVYNPDEATDLPKSCNETKESIYKIQKEGAESLTVEFSDEYVLGRKSALTASKFKIYTDDGECIEYNTWKNNFKDVAGEKLELPGDTAVIYYDPYYSNATAHYDEDLLNFTTSTKRGYEVIYAEDTAKYVEEKTAENAAENEEIKAENDTAIKEAQEEAADKQKINETAISAGKAVDNATTKAETAQLTANVALANTDSKAAAGTTTASKGGISSVTDTGSVTIAKKKVVVAAGKSVTVSYSAKNPDGSAAKATAQSNDSKLVNAEVVNETQLKISAPSSATKGASTTVVVSYNTAFVKLTVVVKNPTKKIAPAKKKVTVKKGKSVTVKFKVTAANNKKAATDSLTAILAKKIGKISKKKVAKGTASLTFMATKKGKSKLTVTLGGKKATVNIVVK